MKKLLFVIIALMFSVAVLAETPDYTPEQKAKINWVQEFVESGNMEMAAPESFSYAVLYYISFSPDASGNFRFYYRKGDGSLGEKWIYGGGHHYIYEQRFSSGMEVQLFGCKLYGSTTGTVNVSIFHRLLSEEQEWQLCDNKNSPTATFPSCRTSEYLQLECEMP